MKMKMAIEKLRVCEPTEEARLGAVFNEGEYVQVLTKAGRAFTITTRNVFEVRPDDVNLNETDMLTGMF